MIRYECGCVAVNEHKTYEGTEFTLIVSACDDDMRDGDPAPFWRRMADKGFAEVEDAVQERLISHLMHLVVDGNRFRELKRLLGVPHVGP